MEQKKKALLKGSAATIFLYYLIFLVILIISGKILDEKPCNEYGDNDHAALVFTILMSSNFISAIAALTVGQRFVRRYDRKSSWMITKALMISLMVVAAIMMLGNFNPGIYVVTCLVTCAPVFIAYYLCFYARCVILGRKRRRN